jgi:hypothetical protein
MTDSSTAPLSGRALDAKLAEAMGWKWWTFDVEGVVTPCKGRYLAEHAWLESDREWRGEDSIVCDGKEWLEEIPHYSTDVSALEPVYEEMERRGLHERFARQLQLDLLASGAFDPVHDLLAPPKPDWFRATHLELWITLRATPEQCARAALSVLSQEGR